MAPIKEVNLNIEVDVLTAGATAEVVNAVLEFLLYQRNQIPFVYKTYAYYVGSWTNELDTFNVQNNAITNFHIERQREQAKKTKEAISAMNELIRGAFENNSIKCLRFLFGATTFTPKEAYTIHIPTESISRNHCHNRHQISTMNLNQTLLSLLTNEDLYTIFSRNLHPTNLFLELQTLQDPTNTLDRRTKIFAKDISQLPASCKDIHLYLSHAQNDPTSAGCCNEIKIFEDFQCLEINVEESNSDKKKLELDECAPAWWEADVIVRGFKENPIKGKSIWAKK